ncbi:Uncharacterised protein [Vibrio cholerae]|nr:Uncharacterised protein [Vibrio cholerae]CSC56796.1 Uncharacterised protein [Vibrio cholerae]CSI71672.1 Uncharacterised protein [Vibrio cholerae]
MHHTTRFWIHRSFPQLIRVHFAQTFIALDRQTAARLFDQPIQRGGKAADRLYSLTTFDKRSRFNQTVQRFRQIG